MRSLLVFPLVVAAAPALAQEAAAVDDAAPGSETSTGATEDELPLIEQGAGSPIEIHQGDIVVTGTRLRGQVIAPQEPIQTLDEEDIASYGAGSLAELISQLSPQTGSGRGRGDGMPVFLMNGRRITSFREMRDLPPEAIRRLEILPEEVALRYGYPPNQRVVNFILKDHFASRTVAGEYDRPTRGGTADAELEAGLVKIDGQSRFNLNGKVAGTSALTEAERNVIQAPASVPTVAGDPDPAQYRTLIGRNREYSLNGTWSTGLGTGPQSASLTVNGAVTRTNTQTLSGLDSVRLTAPDGSTALRTLPGALTRDSENTSIQGGIGFNKPISGWQFTATADGTYNQSETRVAQRRDLSGLVAAAAAGTLPIAGPLPAVARSGPDVAQSKDTSLTALVTLSGAPFRMPAGEASLTVKTGFAYTRSDNADTRGAAGNQTLQRGDLSAGINIALPLTSRSGGVLGGVGDLSANLSLGLNRLSDFGTLKDWSAGLTWGLTDKLQVQASYIVNQAAPSLSQLSNPALPVFNATVYDFTRGETALVTQILGGNPDLKRETQRDWKFSANWALPGLKNSNLIVEYFRNRSSDVTQSFPLLTPEIEAAFPTRMVRDASGRLVSIDLRPVTFSEIKSSRLRWGFNISGAVGKPQPMGSGRPGFMGPRGPGGPRMGGAGRGPGGFGGGGPRGGGGFGGPPGGGFGGGGPGGPGGNGQGRWNLSLYHTVQFTNTVLVAPGGPVLNLLDGDALTAGGVARHSLELEGGTFYRGFGLRLNGNWAAPVTVRANGGPGSSDLRFGSVTKVNLRAFVNFDQQKKIVDKVPLLKGVRLSLKVDNLFDSRQRVTDETGAVPLSYQVDYRDSKGRVIGIDLRKMF